MQKTCSDLVAGSWAQPELLEKSTMYVILLVVAIALIGLSFIRP